jgi:hypothetical protein
MDFFQSHQTVPKPVILPSSIFRTFNCTSKTTGWFTKGAEIDPNLPHANKVLLQGSTRILIYIDGLLSVAPNCARRCYLTFFHIPERSIALVNDWLVHQRAEIDPNLPHANKVLLQGSTHSYIH